MSEVELMATCCVCSVEVFAPAGTSARRREDRTSWYCINGHAQSYQGERPSEKYLRLLEAERKRAGLLIDERDRAQRKVKRLERAARKAAFR